MKQKIVEVGRYATMAEAVKATCPKFSMSNIWWGGQFAVCKELTHVLGGVFCVHEFIKSAPGGKFTCRY